MTYRVPHDISRKIKNQLSDRDVARLSQVDKASYKEISEDNRYWMQKLMQEFGATREDIEYEINKTDKQRQENAIEHPKLYTYKPMTLKELYKETQFITLDTLKNRTADDLLSYGVAFGSVLNVRSGIKNGGTLKMRRSNEQRYTREEPDQDGNDPMKLTMAFRYPYIAKIILRAGLIRPADDSALHYAATIGDLELFQLVEQTMPENKREPHHRFVLSRVGSKEIMDYLISQGYTFTEENIWHMLFQALGDTWGEIPPPETLDFARYLMEKYNLDPDTVLRNIRKATYKSRVIKSLLELGASREILNSMLLDAVKYNTTSLLEDLLKNGADVHYGDEELLMQAVNPDYTAAYNDIINRGYDKRTDYMPSIVQNYLDAFRTLMKYKANIHARDDEALMRAVSSGKEKMVAAVLDAGADIHARNDEALAKAKTLGYQPVIDLLISRGAKPRDTRRSEEQRRDMLRSVGTSRPTIIESEKNRKKDKRGIPMMSFMLSDYI